MAPSGISGGNGDFLHHSVHFAFSGSKIGKIGTQIMNDGVKIVNDRDQIVNDSDKIMNDSDKIVNDSDKTMNDSDKIMNETTKCCVVDDQTADYFVSSGHYCEKTRGFGMVSAYVLWRTILVATGAIIVATSAITSAVRSPCC